MNNSILNKDNNQLISYNFKNKNILKLSDLINLKLLKKTLTNKKIFLFKNKKILLKGNIYLGIKNNSEEISNLLIKEGIKQDIYNKYLKPTINTYTIDEVIKSVFIDYLILIDLYNNKIIDYDYILNYLGFNKNQYNLKKKKNYNLLESNNLSFELKPMTKEQFISGYKLDVKNEIYNLYHQLDIEMIEIPFNYNLKNLKEFLIELLDFKNKFKIKKLNFKLRFKKLKKYKKKGMFIVRENTILLDSRNINSIYHELGHWIYENNISFTFNNQIIDNSKFESIVERNNLNINLDKYEKYEDYDFNSEVFAFWFEGLFNYK